MIEENKHNIKCECGLEHSLSTQKIVVSEHALNELVQDIQNCGYEKILIMFDEKGLDVVLSLQKLMEETNKTLKYYKLKSSLPSLYNAEKIQDFEQDLVIVIGDECVISIVKYYAYSFSCELFLYALNSFVDYTFSSFARLYDGVCFDFYKTIQPKQIYVDTKYNNYNVYHTYYISSKLIAMFENCVAELVFRDICCVRFKNFFKKVINLYVSQEPIDLSEKNAKNIWMLIRLGQAMSFYGQTKSFLGGDFFVVNLLQTQCLDSDILELETIALKLIINSYSCYYSGGLVSGDININKQIQEMSKFLKVSPTEVLKRVTKILSVGDRKDIDGCLKNYFPYLKSVFDKTLNKIFSIHSKISVNSNAINKFSLNYDKVEKSFALSTLFGKRRCTLNLLAIQGYLDKLL